MKCGFLEELCDVPPLSMPLRLLPLCPSASQDPDVPSRVTTATAQTARLPMSLYLSEKENDKKKTMNILKLLRHIYPDLEQTGQFASRCCSSTVKVRRNLPNLI